MRWPAIIFSRIKAFGETYDVFPRTEMPVYYEKYEDKRDKSATTIFLLPSENFDAKIVCPAGVKVGASAALAAAAFLIHTRGLPLSECLIETEEKTYRILQDKKGKLKLTAPKCKQLFSNKPISIGMTEIFISAVTDDFGAMVLTKCYDSDMFSGVALHRMQLLVDEKTPQILGSVAYSLSGENIKAKACQTLKKTIDMPLRLATAIASSLVLPPGMAVTVTLNGVGFGFSVHGFGFAATPLDYSVFTLPLPDVF